MLDFRKQFQEIIEQSYIPMQKILCCDMLLIFSLLLWLKIC